MPVEAPILLGTHVHPATGDAARRQADAVASWRRLPNVSLVNLQFWNQVIEVEGFETLAELRRDSVSVTGRPGIRKPVSSEVFSLLAQTAVERGCSYFAFVNSDINVTEAAIEVLLANGRDACLFSRMDVDANGGGEIGVELAGIDGFAIRAAWWIDHAHGFRPYIIGEAVWDNVYCAQLLCHGHGILMNRRAYITHERHATLWKASPFAEYIQFLSALDAPYFSLWYSYWTRLRELRARGASEAEELALQAEVFVWRPLLADRLAQRGRAAKAHLRYLLQQHRAPLSGAERRGPL